MKVRRTIDCVSRSLLAYKRKLQRNEVKQEKSRSRHANYTALNEINRGANRWRRIGYAFAVVEAYIAAERRV